MGLGANSSKVMERVGGGSLSEVEFGMNGFSAIERV